MEEDLSFGEFIQVIRRKTEQIFTAQETERWNHSSTFAICYDEIWRNVQAGTFADRIPSLIEFNEMTNWRLSYGDEISLCDKSKKKALLVDYLWFIRGEILSGRM